MYKVRLFGQRGFVGDYIYVDAESPEDAVSALPTGSVTREYKHMAELCARVRTPDGQSVDFFKSNSAA